ncbi:glucose-1-phosphatase-like [Manduca sexta]|uniref:glucose-1-phosphatase-like n=1 Tax=Manduca sexta TaxID=7130 RepID=UPI0011841E8F|nr:glucose-1-phosphatase-like [Manduca sexta]
MLVVFILSLVSGVFTADLKLVEVLALSRHNMRTPYTAFLNHFTPKRWPVFDVPPGHLTGKGARMESYMGRYFYEWMASENLIPEGCPGETVYVYANCQERTIETARAFVDGAFPGCNVPVHYRTDVDWDPVFNAIIRNKTKKYANAVMKEMKYKMNLKEYKLKPAYIMMNEIVDLKNSHICIHEDYCDLSKDKNDIIFKVGHPPNVTGPLYIGNSIVDVFIMSFYDDKPYEEVGWGLVRTREQWTLLTKVSKENQNVRYNLTTAGKDLTKPLLEYISDVFLDENKERKFTLLVAHDSNINCLTNVLGFKPFHLPNQFEPFPIGGKLVFQKWTDGFNYFMKVDYVYQSWIKLRYGAEVSLEQPPQIYTMQMKACTVDKDGFCLWSDFVDLLKGTLDRIEQY